MFYLRDKEPGDLQRLLKANSIEYSTEMPEEFKGKLVVRCRVQVQKESAEGLVDGLCNEIAPRDFAGYCRYDVLMRRRKVKCYFTFLTFQGSLY